MPCSTTCGLRWWWQSSLPRRSQRVFPGNRGFEGKLRRHCPNWVEPGDFTVWSCSGRAHSKIQIRQIARSIEAFGFTNAVLIDERCPILAGHSRADRATLPGVTEVPCCGYIIGATMRNALSADARTMFGDPPYNVPIDRHFGKSGKIQPREFTVASGEMSEAGCTGFPATACRDSFRIESSIAYGFLLNFVRTHRGRS